MRTRPRVLSAVLAALFSIALPHCATAQKQIRIEGDRLTFDGVVNWGGVHLVSTLPGTPTAGDRAFVTDGADASDCTVGSGSHQHECVYSGSAWVSSIGQTGATGAAGATGATGATGAAGAAGANGADGEWFDFLSGSGAPDSSAGVYGDFYIRTDTGQIYRKTSPALGSNIVSSASKSYVGLNSGQYWFDSNTGNQGIILVGGVNGYGILDFGGTPRNPIYIRMYGNPYSYAPKNVYFYGSDNGTDWTYVTTVTTAGTPNANAWHEYYFTNPLTKRYWKVEFQALTYSGGTMPAESALELKEATAWSWQVIATVMGADGADGTDAIGGPDTVANLPATPTAGDLFLVNDGASAYDCATGSGATSVLCHYNGSAWVSLSPERGIGDNKILEVDDADLASGQYLKATASGAEGKTFAQVLADLSGAAAASFDWNNQELDDIDGIGIGANAVSYIEIYVESASTSNPQIQIVDKYDDMSGPWIQTYKDRTTGRTASPGDGTGYWWHGFYNDAVTPELIQWAAFYATITDETDGSEDASVDIWNLKDGTGGTNVTLKGLNCGIKDGAPDYTLEVGGEIAIKELSADPADPAEGKAVLWMSDGTGAGDDGDILIKITAGGSTKTVTLVDFSAF